MMTVKKQTHQLNFKRGDRVKSKEHGTGTVLGPEDFEGYERNRPNDKWELVLWDRNKKQCWIGNIWIVMIKLS